MKCRVTPSSNAPFERRIRDALQSTFPPRKVERVIDSWDNFVRGDILEVDHSDGRQHAESYLAGLTARAWHDLDAHPWARELEANWKIVAGELRWALQNAEEVTRRGNSAWVGASESVRSDASSYGPDWKTLVLQDRGRFDVTNANLFPKTVDIVRRAGVPSVEIFFAKQAPKTGIKPHTDFNNYILTAHLALQVSRDRAWIRCGNDRIYWEEGKCIVMDTSFIHETFNEGDTDRYVLIARVWHPEVTAEERLACSFLFNCIDLASSFEGDEDAAITQAVIEAKAALRRLLPARSKSRGFR